MLSQNFWYDVSNYIYFCIDARIKTQNLFFEFSYVEKKSSFKDCSEIQQQNIESRWHCGKQKKNYFQFHLVMTVNT